jgi:hypothetical protein
MLSTVNFPRNEKCFMKLLMSTKGQFKMYLEPEMIERLNEVALRFNRDSKQSVVEEIVTIYLPTWIAVNTSMARAVEFQVQALIGESAQQVNGNPDVIEITPVASEETIIRPRTIGRPKNEKDQGNVGKIRAARKRSS